MPDPKTDVPGEAPPSVPARGYGPDPDFIEEAEDAEREGVRINWLRTITAFEGPELQVERMELDESGYPQPTGRFETLPADTVILALGQETDTAFLRQVPGVEFARESAVRLLDLVRGGVAVNAEDFVMVGHVRCVPSFRFVFSRRGGGRGSGRRRARRPCCPNSPSGAGRAARRGRCPIPPNCSRWT